MKINHLVFLLEEASAEALLNGLLPRVLPNEITVRCITFEGKQDLETQLVHRLRGYRVPDTHFVVLRDKDAADCYLVKRRLTQLCQEAGREDVTLVRIACHELESWYLADLAAVEKALGISGLAAKQKKRKYRPPDHLANAAQELAKLTGSHYQKVLGSRAIGPYLDINNTRSPSFAAFITGIKKLLI